MVVFQSTSSVWRTTIQVYTLRIRICISIHVLRVEDDRLRSSWRPADRNFNPRPPCGGRRVRLICIGKHILISIHVLRVEDDGLSVSPYSHPLHFNPRPPCGGRQDKNDAQQKVEQFQSTSSVWRTTSTDSMPFGTTSISIHVLRVEDDEQSTYHRRAHQISIHVLRVEDDEVAT